MGGTHDAGMVDAEEAVSAEAEEPLHGIGKGEPELASLTRSVRVLWEGGADSERWDVPATQQGTEAVVKPLWTNPDKGGVTFVTIAGVRYQVEGTGHSHKQLVKMVNDGDAIVAGKEKN